MTKGVRHTTLSKSRNEVPVEQQRAMTFDATDSAPRADAGPALQFWHKDASHPGQQEPIVDLNTFERFSSSSVRRRTTRATRSTARAWSAAAIVNGHSPSKLSNGKRPPGYMNTATFAARATGGRYVPETLLQALVQLTVEYAAANRDPKFQAELDYLLKYYIGRPNPLYFAERPTKKCGRAKIYLKREDLNHTGAHKIKNSLGQTLLTLLMGEEPRDRRDRRWATRRRHRHRLCPVRPRMHRLHG